MKVIETAIADVKIIEPQVFGDERGFFIETWRQSSYSEHGIGPHFVQDNQSRSRKGILRGLHYQLKQPQGKLVRVTSGSVFDVAVDLRRSSKTFGQAVGVELSAESHRQLWVPPGFAHGFLVTSEHADFVYKCSDYYAPQHEHTLQWNDPALDIQWPLDDIDELLLSDKDQNGTLLADCETYE